MSIKNSTRFYKDNPITAPVLGILFFGIPTVVAAVFAIVEEEPSFLIPIGIFSIFIAVNIIELVKDIRDYKRTKNNQSITKGSINAAISSLNISYTKTLARSLVAEEATVESICGDIESFKNKILLCTLLCNKHASLKPEYKSLKTTMVIDNETGLKGFVVIMPEASFTECESNFICAVTRRDGNVVFAGEYWTANNDFTVRTYRKGMEISGSDRFSTLEEFMKIINVSLYVVEEDKKD